MTNTIIAANWKMHHGPKKAREFLDRFLGLYAPLEDRGVWLFPPAVSLEQTTQATAGKEGIEVGAQNVHWVAKGAFTGELSVQMAAEAGALAALVGHSERRHVFGETEEETAKKVHAVIEGGLTPVLCVGEKLEEREAGNTLAVIERQLSAVGALGVEVLDKLVVAYEPVWAIGTGKTATPKDAAEVHASIRAWFAAQSANADGLRILYGGSVKPGNAHELLAEEEINGLLVGGASLEAESWWDICRAGTD